MKKYPVLIPVETWEYIREKAAQFIFVDRSILILERKKQ